MRPHCAAVVLLSLTLLVACSEVSESLADETWAQEAEEVVALLADAYDIADPYETARFFTAGGTLDMTIWGYGVAMNYRPWPIPGHPAAPHTGEVSS